MAELLNLVAAPIIWQSYFLSKLCNFTGPCDDTYPISLVLPWKVTHTNTQYTQRNCIIPTVLPCPSAIHSDKHLEIGKLRAYLQTPRESTTRGGWLAAREWGSLHRCCRFDVSCQSWTICQEWSSLKTPMCVATCTFFSYLSRSIWYIWSTPEKRHQLCILTLLYKAICCVASLVLVTTHERSRCFDRLSFAESPCGWACNKPGLSLRPLKGWSIKIPPSTPPPTI